MAERLTGEERRRAIVEAAVALFSQKGFRGTTTKEIAETAGCSEATIFKHFATKNELYSAILEAKSRIEETLAKVAQDGHLLELVGDHWPDGGEYHVLLVAPGAATEPAGVQDDKYKVVIRDPGIQCRLDTTRCVRPFFQPTVNP